VSAVAAIVILLLAFLSGTNPFAQWHWSTWLLFGVFCYFFPVLLRVLDLAAKVVEPPQQK
jgi:hypothetical protein